jgi:hypothetical protein
LKIYEKRPLCRLNFLIITIWIVLISSFAFSESFEESKWYEDYSKMPDKYKSPAAEKMFRDGYEAELKVKMLPCKQGGTIKDCLDLEAAIPAVEDLDWITSPYEGGFEVERLMLLNGTTKLKYHWRVNPDGSVVPVNNKAIEITK